MKFFISILSLVSIFIASFFSGFFVYDNSNSMIEKTLDYYSSSSPALVEAQQFMLEEDWLIEEWENVEATASVPLSNSFSRVVRSIQFKNFDGILYDTNVLSTASYEFDTKYSANHIYISYGGSWNNINNDYVYISDNFAEMLKSSSSYGELEVNNLIGMPITFICSSGEELILKIGGVFFTPSNSYSNYYQSCFDDENIVYVSLENSFKLSSASKEGFVTYENSSKTNFDTYEYIRNNEDIISSAFYNNSLNLDIDNTFAFYSDNMRFLYFALLLLASFFFIFVYIKLTYSIIDAKFGLNFKNEKIKRFVDEKKNIYYLLSVVILGIGCLLILLLRDTTLSFQSVTLSFANTGSMSVVSLSFVILLLFLWGHYLLSKKKEDVFIFDEDKTPKIINVTMKI